MAFQSRNLSVIAYANGFTLWQYGSGADALAAITASGYFNEAAPMLRVADLIVIADSAGSAGIRRVATNAGGTVTVAATA
ncbi:hypothetical protein ABIE65_000695 [Constrictibacter sp. MBR-5]|jgi:hypothetical protein|uniref:hypothetical protein n=1 Tax=Constrictibacter sp. MBR-5 TaxID=3156467 RepID=UPI0033947037